MRELGDQFNDGKEEIEEDAEFDGKTNWQENLNEQAGDTNPKTDESEFFVSISDMAQSIFFIEVKKVFNSRFDNAEWDNDGVVNENEVSSVLRVQQIERVNKHFVITKYYDQQQSSQAVI